MYLEMGMRKYCTVKINKRSFLEQSQSASKSGAKVSFSMKQSVLSQWLTNAMSFYLFLIKSI